jgi:hypothetical protein
MDDLIKWFGDWDKMIVTIFALVGYLIAGITAWNSIRWRVKILENDRDGMKAIIDKQVEITRNVELNSVELKQIAKATERRLQLIEDRQK